MIALLIEPAFIYKLKKNNIELLKLAEKVNVEDNPILLLYEFKDK